MDDELTIIIEEYPMFDSDDNVNMATNIIVNGEHIRNSGSVLKSVLEHLDYTVDISYH